MTHKFLYFILCVNLSLGLIHATHIDDLPNETTLIIFSHICEGEYAEGDYRALSHVSKKWRNLTNDPFLQQKIQIHCLTELNRPLHYIGELFKRHPDMYGRKLYTFLYKDQTAERYACNIPTVVNCTSDWKHYKMYESQLEKINTNIWTNYINNPHWVGISCSRIPAHLWDILYKQNVDVNDFKSIFLNNIYPIRYIPYDFFNYTLLEHLCCRGQKLMALPSSIRKLTNLKHLDISIHGFEGRNRCNLITEFPSSLYDLKNLKTLNISYTGCQKDRDFLDKIFPHTKIIYAESEKNLISPQAWHIKKLYNTNTYSTIPLP